MRTGRLEAFSDGVLAIIITIMVLELHDPEGEGWHDLRHAVPTLLSYLLSFVYIGIYWINHHHLFAATRRASGAVLWANLHLLFWLSVVPWTTSWLGSTTFAQVPTIVYGVSLLLPGVAFVVLQRIIMADEQNRSALAGVLGGDWRGKASPVLYGCGIIAAALDVVPLALAFYAVVALAWIVPDRRVERSLMTDVTDG